MNLYDARALNGQDEPSGMFEDTSQTAHVVEQSGSILRNTEGRRYESEANALPVYMGPIMFDVDSVVRRSPSSLSVPSARQGVQANVDVKAPQNTKAISLTLVNKGSVSRDHLASERTYLAYVRTSLGLSSAGVALMQFLRLGNSTQPYAAPIGAMAILTGLIILLFGTRRFFLIQHALVAGQFPPSVIDIAFIGLMLGSIIAVTLGVIASRPS